MPGPARKATPQTASCTPLARSSVQPARWAAAGSIVSRAVKPAGSNAAPSMAATTSVARVRPPTTSSTGIAATARHDAASETTAIRRRPITSTSVPLNTEETNIGSAAAAPTTPAAAALPVRSRISHGSATRATPLPVPDSSVASSSRMSPPGRRGAAMADMDGSSWRASALPDRVPPHARGRVAVHRRGAGHARRRRPRLRSAVWCAVPSSRCRSPARPTARTWRCCATAAGWPRAGPADWAASSSAACARAGDTACASPVRGGPRAPCACSPRARRRRRPGSTTSACPTTATAT